MRTQPRRLTRAVLLFPLLGIPAGRTAATNRPTRLPRAGATLNHPTVPASAAAIDPPDGEDEPQESQFDDEETESVEEQIEQNRDAGAVTNPPFRHQDEE